MRAAVDHRGGALTAELPPARRGYRRSAVDALLARAAATLGPRAADVPELARFDATAPPADPVTRREVEEVRFPVVVRGYDLAAVDELLRRLAAVLPADATWGGPPVPPPEHPCPPPRLTLRGYDVDEVEEFLGRAAHSLGERVHELPELARYLAHPRTGEPLRPREVDQAQFRVRRRGYDIVEVDALLDRVARALRRAR